MTDQLHIDFESRSEIELDERGLDNYARHPSTQALMLAWAVNEQKVKLWQPHVDGPLPAEVREALEDPFVEKWAWNAQFERTLLKWLFDIWVPYDEWRDPMVTARYLSMPGSLSDVGKILGLKSDEAKLQAGRQHIRFFCSPAVAAQPGGLYGGLPPAFRDWNTDPASWREFCEYCKQDVVAERVIAKKMSKFRLPDLEQKMWVLDQKINEAGLPVDGAVVVGANSIVVEEQKTLMGRLKTITGLENPNSSAQMLEWLQGQGYSFGSLGKVFVAQALSENSNISETAREALTIREQTAKSSIKKYTAIGDTVGPDGRLRYQFSFMGASRTGRWASLGINLQNLPRPLKKVEKRMERALELVRKADLATIASEFGNPLAVVASTLRPSFRAPEGYKLVVCDLNAIENRVIGYVARCQAISDVFKEGRCPYLDFAVEMYGRPYEELHHEWKVLKNATTRNNSKPATLGCGFRLSGGEEVIDKNGDKILTGLLGYASSMGVKMSKEEADRAVQIFRTKYPEVVQLWFDMEASAIAAVEHPGQWFGVATPVNDKDRDKYLRKGRNPNLPPIVSFRCAGQSVLEMKLPSGRSLHYIHPRVDAVTVQGRSGQYVKKSVSYEGREQKSRNWSRIDTHGGKWVENCIQAIARDLLVHGLLLADKMGFPIILHVHDEIGALVPVDSPLGLKNLKQVMSEAPAWANGELLLGAEGYEDFSYRKG